MNIFKKHRSKDTIPQTRCNLCGNVLDEFDLQEDFSFQKRLGYGTKYDMDFLNLKICCQCMEKIIDGCKITPIISDNTYTNLN